MLFLFPLRKKRIEQAVKEERVREEREEQARVSIIPREIRIQY